MQPKSTLMLKVLLNRFHKGAPAALLNCLPEEITKQVNALDVNSSDPLPALRGAQEKLAGLHYSWLAPVLEKMPKDIQPLLLTCLSEHQATRLSQHLHIAKEDKPVSEPVKAYLQSSLYKRVPDIDRVLPLEYLPQTTMSPLATWTKFEIVELIEFLGLHDLAEELRQVVDQKSLKNVYACLTPKEQKYLRICMHHKGKLATPSLGLDRWSGDCEKLKTALQSRGLMRLGKALSGEHPDFMWYLTHILDTGRGKALMKYYSREPAGGITAFLAQQVLNLMNILKKKSE